ncbi:MAG: pantoate--beta-alanine ligase [Sulfuriferula sp.]
MKILHSIEQLRAWRAQNDNVAFVPTMGNLHAGHLALVNLARRHAQQVVVSIFVNPLQFGVNEDFAHYPRTLAQDTAILTDIETGIIFAPNVDELFPGPQRYHIEVPPLASELCGQFRPGHFRGVATIVMKLFNLVQPSVAVFGKKDYQQLTILRDMALDFALPITIVAGETMRAEDGLALSSRNRYLSQSERQAAPYLFACLSHIKNRILQGERHYAQLEQETLDLLSSKGWRVDYISLRNQDLTEPDQNSKQLVVLAAAHLGHTRLIDNLEINL